MPYYDYALDLILDSDSASTEILTEEQHELVESAAEMLYGLIHVRFILTSRGMSAMFEKYKVTVRMASCLTYHLVWCPSVCRGTYWSNPFGAGHKVTCNEREQPLWSWTHGDL